MGSVLHVYHHCSISMVWGYLINIPIAYGTICFGAWINAIVHSIMYLYYGLTAARFNTAPFKQAVTSVQLTQFCMCIAHAVTVVVVPNEVPHNLAMLQFGYHCTMITLFGQFYYASYIAPAQKKKAEKKAALAKQAAAA